jgi:paraquat-inducible protein B
MRPVLTPELESNRTFNLVTSIWIVPLIALLITGWMIYQHFSQLGSEIRINFSSSGGLIPGESVIKFRDVSIGKIVRIGLQEGGDGVTVTARMNKESEAYLNKSTRFWIVTPQVDSSGVRGLDTLLHGAYITMSAPRKGELVTEFFGLEEAYRGQEEGTYFHLKSRKVGNVHVGAAVYYHNLRVGNIDKVDLGSDKRTSEITVFIRKKFVDLVNITTKFWHQDLMAVSMESGQIALDLAPLTSVLLGSISFESQFDKPYPKPSQNHSFRLFNKHRDAVRKKIGSSLEHFVRFRFAFSGTISGLLEGAPIRYQGFKVGEVDKVPIHYNNRTRAMESDVIGLIDTSIFWNKDHNGSVNLKEATCKGLQAELKSNNPLMESLYIDLNYGQDGNATKQCLVAHGGVIDFPTKKVVNNSILPHLDHLLASFTSLADENRVPLRDMLIQLKASAEHLNTLMAKPSFQSLTDDLNKTLGSLSGLMGKSGGIDQALEELQKTLRTTKRIMRGYSSGSLFGKKLEAMLKEVGQTSEETKRLIEKLNKKPNALIFGE